jgi:hypothetical protein
MATQTIRNNANAAQSQKIIGGNSNLPSNFSIKTGKVINVLMDSETPSNELFNRDGAWAGIGTVYYVDYPSEKDANPSVESYDLNTSPKAVPLFPDKKYIPLIGELLLIVSLPSKDTQSSTGNVNQDYYISIINLFNNNNHNSQPPIPGDQASSLGRVFEPNALVKNILPFEGDTIYESRFGSSLHFTSTTRWNKSENWWSNVGNNGDPITFLTNGYFVDTNNLKDLKPHIEDLKKDSSLLVLTSTQLLPYLPEIKFSRNKLFNPPSDYTNSQAMLIADRITINAKKNEILLYGNQLGALINDSIYLESKQDITLKAPKINLGLNSKGNPPIEPVLLGNKTSELIIDILITLQELSKNLSVAFGTMPGSPLTSINKGGQKLLLDINNIVTKYNSNKLISSRLDKLKSKTTYTI